MGKYPKAFVRAVDIELSEDLYTKAMKEFHWDGGIPYIRVYGRDRKILADFVNPGIGVIEESVKKAMN